MSKALDLLDFLIELNFVSAEQISLDHLPAKTVSAFYVDENERLVISDNQVDYVYVIQNFNFRQYSIEKIKTIVLKWLKDNDSQRMLPDLNEVSAIFLDHEFADIAIKINFREFILAEKTELDLFDFEMFGLKWILI